LYQQSRKSRRSVSYDPYALEEPMRKRNRLLENLPVAFAGAMLIGAFAFASHFIGRNAVAHNAELESVTALVAPTSVLNTKGSLLPDDQTFTTINVATLRTQTVMSEGKGDLESVSVVQPVPPPIPKMKPASIKVAAVEKVVKISPAAIDLKNPEEEPVAVKRLVVNPPVPKVATLNPTMKTQVVAQRRLRLAEENCLARGVYFESRSESDLGQLAVAKVILNRVKSPNFPKTICGVVYQGSGSRNSCQFSFACDGQPDDVKSPTAWAHAKAIASRAINNDPSVAMLGSAVNYHADYVKPRWSHTMRRLIRIGHHIFYAHNKNG
jgi:spore germination cell wall hydrolase CwlJ-like protein